jgi:myosin-5
MFAALQAQWRGYSAFVFYKKMNRAAITFQCAWRGKVARKDLKKLKMVSFLLYLCYIMKLG